MFQDQIYQLTYQALFMVLIISAPPILVSMLAGLLVAIFQAATQIQEQTLSFTVKLVAAIFTIIVMGGWISMQIMNFALNIFSNFPRWNH
ncbi:MAG: type III secretion system export apparatus subunit SctS [Verrucomicrobia bacterium]|nr:type III secretion system export apparatus subunit SctS [Verrucomicrobiota bacterium]